jgi:UDP:flavonoid glycosyltransferase YjiC (YdhE family)
VFTLGSAASLDAGDFYIQSALAVQKLRKRGVLIVGRDLNNIPKTKYKNIFIAEYAPISKIFPKAAVVVHQGGVGTTGQALLAGKPMLVVPYAFDQPDNAARVTRLGVAQSIPRNRYNAAFAAKKLENLVTDIRYSKKASELSPIIARENGVAAACDALETIV